MSARQRFKTVPYCRVSLVSTGQRFVTVPYCRVCLQGSVFRQSLTAVCLCIETVPYHHVWLQGSVLKRSLTAVCLYRAAFWYGPLPPCVSTGQRSETVPYRRVFLHSDGHLLLCVSARQRFKTLPYCRVSVRSILLCVYLVITNFKSLNRLKVLCRRGSLHWDGPLLLCVSTEQCFETVPYCCVCLQGCVLRQSLTAVCFCIQTVPYCCVCLQGSVLKRSLTLLCVSTGQRSETVPYRRVSLQGCILHSVSAFRRSLTVVCLCWAAFWDGPYCCVFISL